MNDILNMTVGQTEIHPVIKGTINDSIPVPTYFKEYKQIQNSMLEKAQKIIGTKMPVYLKLGIGRVGLETGLYNIIDENTKVLTIDNGQWGHFGGTLSQNMGAEVQFMEGQKGKQINFEQLKEELTKNHYDIVTMVQNETQTGALYNSQRVREIIKQNKKFYFSMALDNNPEYLFARGLNDLFDSLLKEGLDEIYKQHYIASKAVREAIKILGLNYMADEEVVSPSTTRIVFPEELQKAIDEDRKKLGIDGDRVTTMMKDKYGVCIAEDRIGTMGFYTRKEDILRTIEALSNTLKDLGYSNDKDKALEKVEEIFEN